MKKLRIHCFQHVEFEDLACISAWISKNNYSVTYSKFYKEIKFPKLEDFDWLIVMGGPMSIHDEDEFSWLRDEKKAIKEAIENDKTVLGICLGAQLIANVLGAEVIRNKEKEIGWFDISTCKGENVENLFPIKKFKVFHWHGETFQIPANAVHLVSSEACENQGFLFRNKVLGLQFHLEVTEQSIKAMVEHGINELVPAKYIQNKEEILNNNYHIETNNQLMFQILDKLRNGFNQI